MKRSHGGNSKHSRNLVAKKKATVSSMLIAFQTGDKVRINVNPSHLRGKVETLRFNHKLGMVKKKQGTCYVIDVMDGNKAKQLVLSNLHLERV